MGHSKRRFMVQSTCLELKKKKIQAVIGSSTHTPNELCALSVSAVYFYSCYWNHRILERNIEVIYFNPLPG